MTMDGSGKRKSGRLRWGGSPLAIARELAQRRGAVETDQDLARVVRESPSFVSRHLALLRADQRIQALVGNDRLGLLSALQVQALPAADRRRAIAALGRGERVSVILGRPSRSQGRATGRKPTTRALRERFAQRLREARHRAGLTQFELSERIGLAGGTVGTYETARALPNYPVLLKIADTLGVTLDWLFARSGRRTR